MSFESPVFTNKGKQLLSRALAGEVNLTFTSLALGDGELTSQAISSLNNLINTIKTVPISDKRIITPDQVQLKAIFQNTGMKTGFFWREIGLYAEDPDNPDDRSKDILYCYQNAGDLAEYIPSGDSQLVDKILNFSVVVSDATKVSITFLSETYALKEDFDEHKAQNEIDFKDTNDNLNNHIQDKNNPHQVSCTQIGALPTAGGVMTGAIDWQDQRIAIRCNNAELTGGKFSNYGFVNLATSFNSEKVFFQLETSNGTPRPYFYHSSDNGANIDNIVYMPLSVNGVQADNTGNVAISGVPTGSLIAMAVSTAPAGYLPCNGALISRTSYASLFAVIGTTYGAGDGSTTFALPLINDGKFLRGASTAGATNSAGLPNITGTIQCPDDAYECTNGAFEVVGDTGTESSYVNTSPQKRVSFNASRSSSIYGNSETVMPYSLDITYFIKY